MRLRDVMNQFKNSPPFLLTVNGLCDEYGGDIEKLMKEDYCKEYLDCRVRGMSLLMTNFTPELMVNIERGGKNEELDHCDPDWDPR